MRPRLAAVLLSTTLSAALLAGCGTTGVPTGPGSTLEPAGGATPSTGPSAVDPSSGAFPVVIARTGGVAGFRDRLTVAADGRTTVSPTRGAAATCLLAADALARLGRAVAALPSVAVTTTDARVVDDLVTTLQAPATSGPLRLPDAPQDPVSVVGEILADVGRPVADRTLCPAA